MKYLLSKETAGYFEALLLLTQAKDTAYLSAQAIYGEEQKATEKFDEALETAMDELFKLVRLNAEHNLALIESYNGEEVTV
jgi:hypothetical protein